MEYFVFSRDSLLLIEDEIGLKYQLHCDADEQTIWNKSAVFVARELLSYYGKYSFLPYLTLFHLNEIADILAEETGLCFYNPEVGKDNLRRYLGHLIKESRIRKNVSVEDLATSCGITSKTIDKIETGRYSADLEQIQLLLNALNLNIEIPGISRTIYNMIPADSKITADILRPLLLHRDNNVHKHKMGHLLIVAGCDWMPGAAILTTGAALKSGCGLVTLNSTKSVCQLAMAHYPSALLKPAKVEHEGVNTDFLVKDEDLKPYNVIALGPGLPPYYPDYGRTIAAASLNAIPMVLDAGAFNIPMGHYPKGSVLTPHAGELRRLLKFNSEKEKVTKIKELCARNSCVLVEKGYHSRIYSPDGKVYENTTGGPGLAKGGSGDVLTGLIGGLMARGYDALSAALIAVWVHGYAGDCLTADCGMEAFNSHDLIPYIYRGFKVLEQ